MLHLFSEIPPLLVSLPPTNPNQLCDVTWPLLPSSPISLLLIVVIFYSPVFAMCCLSCLPICTSSVRTLSVNFLFVTPSCLCQNLSVGLVVAYSSHIFRSPWILTTARLRQQDCAKTSSTTVARLQCWRVSNFLWFCDATSLMMTMAARWQSPQILDRGKTAMARLPNDLLNDCGKTAVSARQQ